MTDQDYMREVYCHVSAAVNENDSILQDIRGDSLEASIRRAAIDGFIAQAFDRDIVRLIKGMKIAGIEAEKAAMAISANHSLLEREKGRL